MTSTQPRRVVDLGALAGLIADQLAEPSYALDVAVTGNTGDGFLTFDTAPVEVRGASPRMFDFVIRATVDHVSDGEVEVVGAAGEVIEIVVRRASA